MHNVYKVRSLTNNVRVNNIRRVCNQDDDIAIIITFFTLVGNVSNFKLRSIVSNFSPEYKQTQQMTKELKLE